VLLAACAAGLRLRAGAPVQARSRSRWGMCYPEYSSLRADPLGAMAFCESLERMPGLSVRRDFSDTNELPEERERSICTWPRRHLRWTGLPDELVREIEHSSPTAGGWPLRSFRKRPSRAERSLTKKTLIRAIAEEEVQGATRQGRQQEEA